MKLIQPYFNSIITFPLWITLFVSKSHFLREKNISFDLWPLTPLTIEDIIFLLIAQLVKLFNPLTLQKIGFVSAFLRSMKLFPGPIFLSQILNSNFTKISRIPKIIWDSFWFQFIYLGNSKLCLRDGTRVGKEIISGGRGPGDS